MSSRPRRFVDLPDGTYFDIASIRGIGPVYRETPEQAEIRKDTLRPPHDNMYLVDFYDGDIEWWSNELVPRDELKRLVDTPITTS